MNTVYLISGTLGAGKSTTSKEIASRLDNCELIVGDDFQEQTVNSGLLWQDRLEFSWRKITDKTKAALSVNKDVVIDFVVEDELPKFKQNLSNFDYKLVYAILIASKAELAKRLGSRGDSNYQDRSFELLDQLSLDPQNSKYLINTTYKSADEVVEIVLNSKQLEIEPT